MDGGNWAYECEILKENSRSIYARSAVDLTVYRIEKKSKKVYCDGELYSSTCEYYM